MPQCEPEEVGGRIIFVSMFDDIVWRENDNTEECDQNAMEVGNYARKFPRGHWSFLGPGLKKTWYRTCTEKPNRKSDGTRGTNDSSFGYNIWSPSISCLQSVGKGELDFREYGKKSTRLSDNDRNVESLHRTIKPVNQLSICEFIAHRANTWTKIHLNLPHPMIQTVQEHFMQYGHWK